MNKMPMSRANLLLPSFHEICDNLASEQTCTLLAVSEAALGQAVVLDLPLYRGKTAAE